MLRSQAALCLSTGSFEMSVFHTLLAGNIGQLARVAVGPAGLDSGANAAVARDCPGAWLAGPGEVAGPVADGAAGAAAAAPPQAASTATEIASSSGPV